METLSGHHNGDVGEISNFLLSALAIQVNIGYNKLGTHYAAGSKGVGAPRCTVREVGLSAQQIKLHHRISLSIFAEIVRAGGSFVLAFRAALG